MTPAKRLVVLTVLSAAVAGCGLSAQNVPLPGHGVSGDTYRLQGVFSDALNLSEGAPVKTKGVTIGEVHTVTADDYKARISMRIARSTTLHVGAKARLRGTTPLGELYVDVTDGASGRPLPDGATLTSTDVAPTIEDTMTATSLFINGGGLNQLGTILRESNRALDGRQDSARDLITRLDTTTQTLSESADEIDATLARLAGLSETLRRRQDSIHLALDEVGPAARELRSHVDDILTLLSGVDRLGRLSKSVIDDIRVSLLRGLRQLGPIFDQVNSLEPDLAPAAARLVEFSRSLDRAVPTSNLGVYLHIKLAESSFESAGSPEATSSGSSDQAQSSSPSALGPTLPKVRVPDLPLDTQGIPLVPNPNDIVDQLNGVIALVNP